MIQPPKIQKGAHFRIVSPSSSIQKVGGIEANWPAYEALTNLGFRLSFSEHYEEHDLAGSASIASRVADIHAAFFDEDVDAILCTIGGFNANELLPYLDYEKIAQHPKIFCGYSDTTAIQHALLAKCQLRTYSGPSYTAFKMKELQAYQTKMWLRALTETAPYVLEASQEWSSDPWFLPEEPRALFQNEWKSYHGGKATGTIVGANTSTLSLLMGTAYHPKIKEPILFAESAEEDDYLAFHRQLTGLLQNYPDLKGLVLGRFPKEVGMTEEYLHFLLDKFPRLQEIPVLYDVNFGHAQPIFTFPIGGQVELDATKKQLKIIEG